MFAKRSCRALALLLALPSAAFALGLGDIHLLSSLNAPLNAQIELTDVAPDELDSLQAQLASRDTFAHYGLDWPGYLAGIQVHTVHTSDGRNLITLKSTDAITDPFITLLVEVNWSHGRLVREYTVLLDPPVYAPGHPALANATVAPSTGAGPREGAIARHGAAAAQAEPTPVPAVPAGESANATATAAAPEQPPSSQSTHVVRSGETLSGIAAGVAGAAADSAAARRWIVAIYRANPHAFDHNMNRMRSGAVLRIPAADQAAAVSPREASAEIRRQYAAWHPAAAPAAGSPAQSAGEPGHLKLVAPPQAPGAGTSSAAASGEVAQLQSQLHDLQGQLAESQRLLELKNADLARLQAQLAAKQGTAAAQPAAPAPAATPPAPPAATAQEQPPAPPEQAPVPPAAASTAAPASAPEAAPAAAHKAPAEGTEGSLYGTLKDLWWIVALAILALLGFLGLRFARARRAAQFDDSLGRLAIAGAEASAATGTFTSAPRPPARVASSAEALTKPEAAFVVEESGTHERARAAAGSPAAPAARHVASDETLSSETAINLDQGDPLAEADFHMAYGLYDQAADLVRIAIGREPARRDLKLKLLEVFFVWGNKEQFLQTARELADTKAAAAPGEWEKILIMGKQLAPEDALFSGGGAVSGATAGGVDLDLEGGQSRVDFDLLGEPVPAEEPQSVDLDIGAAVGRGEGEATTNVTDRNAALLENSFLASTGTTREMTARMQSGAAPAEAEAPTVEQPQLAAAPDRTIREKLATALRQGGVDQTAELAIDDLGLDVGQADTVDQPGVAAAANSLPDAPTLVAGMDEHSRHLMEDAQQRAGTGGASSTGAWQFDQSELEAALTHTDLQTPDVSATSRLAALGALDVDVGDATGTHAAAPAVDLDVGAATGTHATNGGGLDLDVGTATVPDTGFAATQRLSSEDLALPDLEPVTMSEVGTKLDLARAYMDMGDPDGARNILEEVLSEGSAAQKQEAQRLMESLP